MEKDKLGIIFSYANAGLGHLRVTDALADGMPLGFPSLVINPQDKGIRMLHRIGSTWPILRGLTEWFQNGLPAEFFTKVYKSYLRRSSNDAKVTLEISIKNWRPKPEKILVVCTHFGLAHGLAWAKNEIEKEENLKIFLVVQVTDDSPQYIWYVEGADIIFVPSQKTKDELITYGKQKNLAPVNFVVNPYPVSKTLGINLTKDEYLGKQNQLDPAKKDKIHFSIPIPGAAVGTEFKERLISELSTYSPRFVFHIITREAPYTRKFIKSMSGLENVEVVSSKVDREVVDDYENLFKKQIISLEVTKPSEQAFKAIFSPETRGGVIMLFSRPVGRQEYDNLDFLIRHKLIPEDGEQKKLFELAQRKEIITDELRYIFSFWRGLRLPDDPAAAANFIYWCFKEKIFQKMLVIEDLRIPAGFEEELGSEGVARFWTKTFEILNL